MNSYLSGPTLMLPPTGLNTKWSKLWLFHDRIFPEGIPNDLISRNGSRKMGTSGHFCSLSVPIPMRCLDIGATLWSATDVAQSIKVTEVS